MALAFDGNSQNTFSTASSGTVTLSTSNADDIIVVALHCEKTSGAAANVTSVTATGLTFTKRKQYQWTGGPHSNPNDMEVWWAHAAAALSSTVITVNLDSSIDDATIVAFGVTGADTTTPFDVDASLPAVANDAGGTNTTPTVTGISTTNPDTLMFSVWGSPNDYVGTPLDRPSDDFTIIINYQNDGASDYSTQESQYKIQTVAQSSVTLAYGGSSGTRLANHWGMIVDALALSSSVDVITSVDFADDGGFSATPTIDVITSVDFMDDGGLDVSITSDVLLSVNFADDTGFMVWAVTVLPPPPVQSIVVIAGM